ncbi:MAG TPA: polysaccharide biosynthesis tyrosine autokinase [Solirubrobacteraceae bacterium]|jgi:succinoglycan biosynthesis transport protein ExoP|nr:polysaccharide biosynthesis tyrosine autokinase [Solirubrobacteraceae bacterium]
MNPQEQPRATAASDALTSAARILRRRWILIAGVMIACVGVAVLKHERAVKLYEATSSVRFQSGTLSDAALQVSPGGSGEPQREADTEVLVAHSPEVAEGVLKQLISQGVHISASANQLLGEVKVEAAQNADVLNIIASTSSPALSAALANAFAQQYIAFRSSSQLAGIQVAESKLQQQISGLPAGSAELAPLQQEVQRLNALRAVAGGGANVIALATPPTSPSGSSLSTSVVIGVLVGLAIAFSLVFLLESLDRRIKSIDELETEYRLPALTGVPQSAFRSRRAADRGEDLEPYRILRSALDLAAVSHQLDTLLVTSAIEGEGKTTVAVDLAHAVALTGRHTVLIELDLRRPTFARHFDLDPSYGITTALVGAASLEDLLVKPLPDTPSLIVLPAGRLPHNPSELLSSPRITEMIAALTTEDGIVIIDAPPLNPVADTQVLLNNPAIHASIIVARVDQTTRDEVRRARGILDRHVVSPIGIAVTGLRDANIYGYSAYRGQDPTLDVDFGIGSSAPTTVESGGLRL